MGHTERHSSRKPTLAGKTVMVVEVGAAGALGGRSTSTHKYDMEEQGATVIYAQENKGGDLRWQVGGIKAELEAMPQKPDVLFIHHPRMDMHEGSFETNPAMQLAKAAKEMGIPTLIQDYYPGLQETDRQVMQANGAAFRDLDVFYDEIISVITSIANNKAKILRSEGGPLPDMY